MSFYDDASWLLIPSGIEEDIVFAQKPTSGLGDLTFTRASDATYTDSTGVVRRSPYNLLTFSEMFSDSSWSKGNTTIAIDTTTAPNGTLTADTLTEDTANSQHTISKSFAVISGSSYTQSWYVKPNGRTQVQLEFSFGAKPVFDLIGNGSATLGGVIQNVGNGWYRISWTATSSITASLNAILKLSNGGSTTYVGNGTSGVFIWGAQIVEGTSALDYFPTTNRQDVPRIDFRNADGTLSSCGRLLLEPQRTNSLFYSQEFDNAYFAKSNSSISTNVAISPSGQQNADKLVPDTSNSIHSVNKSSQSIVGGIYSVFAKADGYDWILLTSHSSISPTSRGAFFNVNNGTVGTTGAGVNAKIQNYGNGWYRCSISEGSSPSSIWTVIATNADNVTTFAGNGTDGVLIWGGQNEQGTYPTTYIPTTTAAVTRIADAASKTGVSSLIGQTEGTLFVDIIPTDVTITNAIGINNGSTNDRVIIFTGSNLIFAQVRVGGVTQFSVTTSATVDVRYKGAIAYKGNDFAFYLNGAQIAVSNTGTVPACSIISYDGGGGISPFLGRNNQAALFPTRLTNAQLAQLTTL